jgi:hypothetical protein
MTVLRTCAFAIAYAAIVAAAVVVAQGAPPFVYQGF